MVMASFDKGLKMYVMFIPVKMLLKPALRNKWCLYELSEETVRASLNSLFEGSTRLTRLNQYDFSNFQAHVD